MPLLPGSDRATISENIDELTHHGSRKRSHAQIVAIALSNADRHPHADGGSAATRVAARIAHRQAGGVGFSGSDVPYFERQEARDITSPYGLAVGTGGGRSDIRNVAVGGSSYVIPADVVAGLGDGNTLAGAKTFDHILASMPWGIQAPRATGHRGPPPAPHDPALMAGITGDTREPPITPTLADGGEAKEVPIAMAHGEYTLSPEQVLRIGQFYSNDRDRAAYPKTHERMLRRGHKILDSFVKEIRGRTIKHLKSLKGPIGSSEPNKGHT